MCPQYASTFEQKSGSFLTNLHNLSTYPISTPVNFSKLYRQISLDKSHNEPMPVYKRSPADHASESLSAYILPANHVKSYTFLLSKVGPWKARWVFVSGKFGTDSCTNWGHYVGGYS